MCLLAHADQQAQDLNLVLSSFVDSRGQVNYDELRANPLALKSFVDFVAAVSPLSHPEQFPTRDSQMAYWINTYNALVMWGIVENPGVSSVKDVSFANGFFRRLKFTVGGKQMTLNHIEHKILRKQYKDPRIHFAVNCGSASCPLLGERMFRLENLDAQLDSAATTFIGDPANVRIDHTEKRIYLSRIFKWYKKDFSWQGYDGLLPTILHYLPPERKAGLDLTGYRVVYLDYDWSLNDRNK